MLSKSQLEEISFNIIGCAIEVNKHIGQGLLESVYQLCFTEELLS